MRKKTQEAAKASMTSLNLKLQMKECADTSAEVIMTTAWVIEASFSIKPLSITDPPW